MPHLTGNSNFSSVLLECGDRVGVVHARELRLDQRLQPRDAILVDELLEERHVVGALLQEVAIDRLQEILGELRVVVDVRERDLRLDHPELAEMPPRVRVLGAERRAERVDLAERHAIGLDVELARHGEPRFLAEEVLVEVDLAVGRAGQVVEIERRYAEHLAGALGIGRRDDRRVDPEEAARIEEPMHGHRERVTHARGGADDVGAHAEMRDLAQVLHRVALRLHRIMIRILDPADNLDGIRAHLERLPLALRRDQLADDAHRAASRDLAARRSTQFASTGGRDDLRAAPKHVGVVHWRGTTGGHFESRQRANPSLRS